MDRPIYYRWHQAPVSASDKLAYYGTAIPTFLVVLGAVAALAHQAWERGFQSDDLWVVLAVIGVLSGGPARPAPFRFVELSGHHVRLRGLLEERMLPTSEIRRVVWISSDRAILELESGLRVGIFRVPADRLQQFATGLAEERREAVWDRRHELDLDGPEVSRIVAVLLLPAVGWLVWYWFRDASVAWASATGLAVLGAVSVFLLSLFTGLWKGV